MVIDRYQPIPTQFNMIVWLGLGVSRCGMTFLLFDVFGVWSYNMISSGIFLGWWWHGSLTRRISRMKGQLCQFATTLWGGRWGVSVRVKEESLGGYRPCDLSVCLVLFSTFLTSSLLFFSTYHQPFSFVNFDYMHVAVIISFYFLFFIFSPQ